MSLSSSARARLAFNRQGRNRKRLLHEMQVSAYKFRHGALSGILRAALNV
jgi:hypothetical protein